MNRSLAELIVRNPDTALMQFTVSQVQRMIDAGIISEDVHFELLDGVILYRDARDTDHGLQVREVRRGMVMDACGRFMMSELRNSNFSVKCTTPIEIEHGCHYEPDLTIIRGSSRDYFPRYPGPEATVLVIDIADHVLERAPQTRLMQFASAGIPEYRIVDLCEDQVEVYKSPDRQREAYRDCHKYGQNDTLKITIPGRQDLKVSVQDILNGTL